MCNYINLQWSCGCVQKFEYTSDAYANWVNTVLSKQIAKRKCGVCDKDTLLTNCDYVSNFQEPERYNITDDWEEFEDVNDFSDDDDIEWEDEQESEPSEPTMLTDCNETTKEVR